MAFGEGRITASGLSYGRDGTAILRDLSFRIDEPRVGIVGRNGSGKTTLARLLCGLIGPTAGEVRIDGVDVASDRRRAIGTVGIIFQNPDHQIIFPTVEEEIGFGLRQLGRSREAARAEARALLARFGRADWAERPVAGLSQGQRHLVCLLAVLAMAPAVIVLDEPFAGLDIPTSRQLHRWLAGLPQTLVLISHDPEAFAGFDRMIWLEEGRIRRDGDGRAVLAEFRHAMELLGDGDALSDLAG